MSYTLDMDELKDELESLASTIGDYVEEYFPKIFEDGFDPEDVEDLKKIMKKKKFDGDMADDFDRAILILEFAEEFPGGLDCGLYFVHEDDIEDHYGENYALEFYDHATVKGLSPYVDWSSFAEDNASALTLVEFDGETYYYQEM